MKLTSLIILLSFAASLFACGGGPGTNTNSDPAPAPQANSSLAEVSSANSEANIIDAANSNIQNSPPPKRAVKAKPEETPVPGPDDSEITTENNAQGDLVETRVFKNNDMVAKVERTRNASKKEASIKVYLKNGKVYEIPAGKIKDVLSESPEEIIKAVGTDVMTAGSQPANKTQIDTKSGSANSVPANTIPTPERRPNY